MWSILLLLACKQDPEDTASCPGPACAEDCENGVDDDEDGAADCADAACAPRCIEDCTNGADDNADWLIDCADPQCTASCDGDGDGYIGPQSGGPDCDDADGAVYPGAAEVYYDGLDNDCDPATDDADQDGDGVAVDADCDDLAAATFPGAPETCGDGAVNDCDATSAPPRSVCYGERSLGTADYLLDGFETDGWAGYAVAGGDTDGDGVPDLLIGSYGHGEFDDGAAYVVKGPLARHTDLSVVGCQLTGVGADDWFGSTATAISDFDGDGNIDFVVGARYQDIPGSRAGAAYTLLDPCVPGPVGASAYELDAGGYYEFGTSLADAGDMDGDGRAELAIGAPQRNDPVSDAGAVFVFASPFPQHGTVNDAWLVLYGTEANALAGQAVGSPGDTDGDGRADLVVGAPFSDLLGTDSGRIYLVNETLAGAYPLSSYVTAAAGDEDDLFGSMIVSKTGDLTGDGRADLVVGAPYGEGMAPGAGVVWLIDQVFPTVHVFGTLRGVADGDTFGMSGAALDVDGDGEQDLVIGAPRDDTTGPDAGAVYTFFGPFSGDRDAVDADVTLLGEAEFDFAGTAVGVAGDHDGDGQPDLVIGAPYHDALAPSSGRAYVLTFGL